MSDLSPAEFDDMAAKLAVLGLTDRQLRWLGADDQADAANGGGLTVATTPVYEWRELWGEESGGLNANSAEWSYGNGDVGNIGIPWTDGWEITEGYVQSDTNPAGSTITIEIMDFQDTAVAVLGTYTISGVQVNNASGVAPLSIAVPSGAVVGFRTDTFTGTWSSTRVGVRARRLAADAVTSVSL